MAIRVYQGAVTDGGMDGVAVSEHGSSNGEMFPIVIDGLYPTAATVSKEISFAIRADAGEEYWGVCVSFWDNDYNKEKIKMLSDLYPIRVLTGSLNGSDNYIAFLPVVQNKNIILRATVTADQTELGTSDTKTNIMITWAKKVTV